MELIHSDIDIHGYPWIFIFYFSSKDNFHFYLQLKTNKLTKIK